MSFIWIVRKFTLNSCHKAIFLAWVKERTLPLSVQTQHYTWLETWLYETQCFMWQATHKFNDLWLGEPDWVIYAYLSRKKLNVSFFVVTVLKRHLKTWQTYALFMAVLKWQCTKNVDRLSIEQCAQLSWKMEYKKNSFLAKYSWKSSWLTPVCNLIL